MTESDKTNMKEKFLSVDVRSADAKLGQTEPLKDWKGGVLEPATPQRLMRLVKQFFRVGASIDDTKEMMTVFGVAPEKKEEQYEKTFQDILYDKKVSAVMAPVLTPEVFQSSINGQADYALFNAGHMNQLLQYDPSLVVRMKLFITLPTEEMGRKHLLSPEEEDRVMNGRWHIDDLVRSVESKPDTLKPITEMLSSEICNFSLPNFFAMVDRLLTTHNPKILPVLAKLFNWSPEMVTEIEAMSPEQQDKVVLEELGREISVFITRIEVMTKFLSKIVTLNLPIEDKIKLADELEKQKLAFREYKKVLEAWYSQPTLEEKTAALKEASSQQIIFLEDFRQLPNLLNSVAA